MNEAIAVYMKKQYNLMIGEQTSERIKLEIGSAYPLKEEMSMEVAGRDAITGLRRRTVIHSEEVRECLRDPVKLIVAAIQTTLEKTPPELSADLVETGITMAGGGALLARDRSPDRRVDPAAGAGRRGPTHLRGARHRAVPRSTGALQPRCSTPARRHEHVRRTPPGVPPCSVGPGSAWLAHDCPAREP
jgi:rod shape-determining protein MreB